MSLISISNSLSATTRRAWARLLAVRTSWPRLVEHRGQIFECVLVVLDQEDSERSMDRRPGRAAAAVARAGSTGSGDRGDLEGEGGPLPLPSLEAQRRPPCCSTIDRLMASPSPSPPNSASVGGPPCSNRLKIRGEQFGLDADASINDLDHQPGRIGGSVGLARGSRDRIVIVPPGGVNLIAFLRRFQRTCWNRAGSASTW